MKKLLVVGLAALSFNLFAVTATQERPVGDLIDRPVEDDEEDEDWEDEMGFQYLYVDTNSLNIRAHENSNSRILGKLYKYSVIPYFSNEKPEGWVCYTFVGYSEGEGGYEGWVSADYLKSVGEENDPIPEGLLNRSWELLSGDGTCGELKFIKDSGNLTALYIINLKSTYEMGGGLDWEPIEVSYSDGFLSITDWEKEYPSCWYNAKTGLLVFNESLWKLK